MIAYDPRGMTWDQYCKLMAELFAPNQLGYVEEENWRNWADGLSGIGYFSESAIPTSQGFEHWYEWAERVAGILSVTVGQK
jgi:hypothetical protein